MNVTLRRQLLAPATRRFFSTSPMLSSGHNRWSKIRHEKGAADRKKQAERNVMAKTIAFTAKTYGADPGMNTQLAALIQQAKKSGATKAFIEAAVNRGLGKSATGASLESVMIEGMTPGNVALVIECETDSKGRSLQDLKHELKKHGGKDAGSTQFFFEHVGKLVFERPADADEARIDDIVNAAINLDVVDVEIGPAIEEGKEVEEEEEEEEEQEGEGWAGPGEIVVWTKPSLAMAIAKEFGETVGLKQVSVDVIWKAKEDMRVTVDKPHVVREITELLQRLRDYGEVTGVYANGVPGEEIDEEEWAKVEELLDGN